MRGVLDFHHIDDPGPMLPWELMEYLRDLFRCDCVEFDRTEPGRESFLDLQALSDTREYIPDEPHDPHYWELYWSSVACNYPDRTGDIAHVTKVSDFLSDREWRSSAIYADYAREGQFREMAAYFPDEPGHTLRMLFWRGQGRDFSERDRVLLNLLRPHLVAVYRRAERRRLAPATLTARQSELLRYVSQGFTNAQVARRMRLSEGTVRTHLTHIYERLGVTSRTAAVTRMSSAGLE